MPLQTTLVTGYLYAPDGAPLANTPVTIRLTKQDRDGNIVVPEVVTANTDAMGYLAVQLWPNTRGVAGSQYRLTVKTFGLASERKLIDRLMTVPDTGTAALADILDSGPPDPQSASSALAAATRVAALAAQAATSASDALQSSFVSGEYADDAGARATAAAASAAEALGYRSQTQTLRDQTEVLRDQANATVTSTSASASAAAASATASQNSAIEAGNQAFLSGQSATAALAAARTYVSTDAGIAATTSGQVFLVTTGNPQVFQVYSNNSGSAALLGDLNIADGTLLRVGETEPHAFVIADELDNIAFAVGRNGEVKTKLLEISAPFKPLSELNVDADGGLSTTAFSAENTPGMFKYAIADEQGNVILGVDSMGRLVANFDLAPIPALPDVFKTGGTYDYDINHVFTYGQSLSVGQALPIQSPTQKYDNLMFFRGQRPQYDYPNEAPAVWYQSLIPSYEFVSPTEPSLGETPSAGTGDMIKEPVLAEDGKAFTDHTYQILTSAPGFGARTIAQLSKGSEHFSRMVQQVGFGLSLSNALGKTYAVQAVTWTQGESDYLSGTSRATYLDSFNQLAADIQTDLKATSGQSKAIPVISYQVATHKTGGSATPTIALAQLDAEAANPLIYIATPMYHLPYQDGFHLTGVGSKWLGGYYGLAYKRIVIDGIDWKPLKPISAVRQSSIIELRFNVPSGRLVFDTTQVSANTNMGFELVDAAGAALTITSVAIVDYDRVRIVASAAVPAGAKVRYAWSGAGDFGPVNGPRGNLRDTQGDDILFDPNGINKRMDNWCVIFEMGV